MGLSLTAEILSLDIAYSAKRKIWRKPTVERTFTRSVANTWSIKKIETISGKKEQSKFGAHLKAERNAGVKCKDDGIRVKKYYKDTAKKASKLTSSAAHHLLTYCLPGLTIRGCGPSGEKNDRSLEVMEDHAV